MHKLFVAALAATALLHAAAQAQDADSVGQINVTANQGIYKLAPQEFTPYEASYTLDTGEQIVLRRQVGRYFVQLKGEREVEIAGTRPGAFASRDGLTLEFSNDGDTVVLRNLSRLPGAAPALAANDIHVASR